MTVNQSLEKPQERAPAQLEIRVQWWANPLVLLLLVTGLTAVVSISLPESVYTTWSTPKYLQGTESAILLSGIGLTAFGIALGLQGWRHDSSRVVSFNAEQLRWMRKAYLITLRLTIFGYVMWMLVSLTSGVGIGDLAAVVQRDESAIGRLKDQSRPVGGLTTWTQLGPVAVALGVILRRLGYRNRGVWVVIGLSAFRTLFYAERLALLETLIPALLLLALTASPESRSYRLLRSAPLVAPPAVWTLFAMSEYTRSWVYYETTTDQPFAQWVTVRMLGYYTTSYNNSALLHSTLPRDAPPYYSVDAFWNAPGIGGIFSVDTIGTLPSENWWFQTLRSGANMEFTNTGSYLVVFAEFSAVFAAVLCVLLGFLYGRLYRGLLYASVPALIAYCALLVGLLELPRFNYISLGRCTPTLLALLVISLSYPRARAKPLPNLGAQKRRT